jgi:hypothetical protein
MPPPLRHGVHEFLSIAIRIPSSRVRVHPAIACLRVEVVEGALHETGVHEQSFNAVSTPGAPFVSGTTIDQKSLAFNGHPGGALDLGVGRQGAGCPYRARDPAQLPKKCPPLQGRSFAGPRSGMIGCGVRTAASF